MEKFDGKKKKNKMHFSANGQKNSLYAPVQDSINSDVLGSYTGNPEYDDIPEQDADDL